METMVKLTSLPAGCEPMLLQSQKHPFQHQDWIYEPKLDGMRCIAVVDAAQTQLFSRNGRNITNTFPAIAKSLSTQKCNMVLDGEIIAFNEEGTVDFDNLQTRWMIKDPIKAAQQDHLNPTAFYAFDLIRLNDESVASKSLLERKTLFHDHFAETNLLKKVTYFEDGMTLYESCRLHKFEGIVAKKSSSTYKPGIRSKDWIKIKFTQKEIFAIVGHVESEGFLLAHYRLDGIKIVGTVQYGFSTAHHEQLAKRLQQIPAPAPSKKPTVWFKPIAVEIEFMTWTKQGSLRFPVFKGFA